GTATFNVVSFTRVTTTAWPPTVTVGSAVGRGAPEKMPRFPPLQASSTDKRNGGGGTTGRAGMERSVHPARTGNSTISPRRRIAASYAPEQRPARIDAQIRIVATRGSRYFRSMALPL